MMHLIYTLFIALANNLDNISVRIAYSIKGIKISMLKNAWISIITFIMSALASLSGNLLFTILSKRVESIISMVILTAIGFWIMLGTGTKNEEEDKPIKEGGNGISRILRSPEKADRDNSKDIDFKEATVLGVALSLNNLGGGLSAGMIGLNYLLVGFLSALLSFIALWAGNYITQFLSRKNLGRKATIIAGLSLIFIGLRQIL